MVLVSRNWGEEKASPLPTKSPRGRGRRDKFRGELQVGSGQREEGREGGRPIPRPAGGGQVGVPFDSQLRASLCYIHRT